MNCSELITTFLADYFDGTLPPDTLADFEHHLDVCESCVAYLRTYRETITMAARGRHRAARRRAGRAGGSGEGDPGRAVVGHTVFSPERAARVERAK